MAHLETGRTRAGWLNNVCSPAWLIAHLGFYLVTGTALVVLNALTAPTDLWFWRPLVLLGALLTVHGVATLVRRKGVRFEPVGALARSARLHLAAVREILLRPAVAGVVAMPGLFSLTSTRPTPNLIPPPIQSLEDHRAASAYPGRVQEAATPPSGWASPAGSVRAAPTPAAPILTDPVPATPVPSAYATWPAMPAPLSPAPGPTQAWPAAAAPGSAPAPGRPTDSFWQTAPAKPAASAWSDTWPAPVAVAPPARPTPPRRLEHDTVLIGDRRTDPKYPPWDQLEVAASTWLAHRASDLDGSESAP
jgi:hypothetical protein